MARMLEAGEDPMLSPAAWSIFASEDIERRSQAKQVAVAAMQSFDFVGSRRRITAGAVREPTSLGAKEQQDYIAYKWPWLQLRTRLPAGTEHLRNARQKVMEICYPKVTNNPRFRALLPSNIP
jgi:replication-associated recombination protein RarA